MANLSLVFDILAKDNASATFKKVGDESERAGQKLSGAARGIDGVAGSLKAGAAALAGAALVTTFKDLYDAAAESQRIGRLTESTIKATGGAAQISADQVGDLAAAISAKTGIDDEAIQSGQNLLLTFKNIRNETGAGNDIFNQATQALADMSTVLGTDASGSAIQLGKALNDPIKGITTLSRAGVQFTEDQKEQIRTLVESGDVLGAQKIILGELTAQFGGAAEAAATPLDKMKVAVGNIAESIGSYLIPVVDTFATQGLVALEAIGQGFTDGDTSAEGFEGAMQNVGVALSDAATAAGQLVDIGQAVFGFFTDLPTPILLGVGAIGGFIALKGPVSDALDTMALKALYLRDNVSQAGGVMGGVKGAAGGLVSLLGGPWGIAVGAATVGLGFLVDGLKDSEDVAADAETAQRTFADSIRETNGVIDENVRAAAAKAAQDAGLLDIADDLGLSLPQVTDAVLGNRDAYNELVTAANAYYDESLSSENAGDLGMTENAARVDDLIEGLDILRPTVSETRQEQEALGEASAQTGTALGDAVIPADDFAASMEEAAQQVSDVKKEVDAYKLSLDILTGAHVSLIDVQSAFYDSLEFSAESLAGLEGAVAGANGELNLQSEAGRFASDTLLGVRDAGNQLIATMIEQGGTSDDVRAQDAALRASFEATAEEMGFTSDEATNLANQILGIPEERQVEIDADIASASGNITALQSQIDNLRGKDITIRASTALSGLNGGPQPVGGRAMGGRIRGPGTGTSDSILGIDAYTGAPTAWVSNAEFVTNAREYARNPALVEAINAGQVPAGINPADLKYFAAGGPIINIGLPSLSGLSVDAPAEALASLNAVTPGGGALGSTWQSIFAFVKARIPQARQNSTYRPGDPGFHGRGKAVDFGFGSGPGGAGSAGLASINRLLHDTVGGQLAELIYDGIGDDRPDLKYGRPLNYGAATSAQHRNHVHAAVRRDGGPVGSILNPHVRDKGGPLLPGFTYNGLGRPELVIPGYANGGLIAEDGSVVNAGFYSKTAGASEGTLLASADKRMAMGQALTADQAAAVARRSASNSAASDPLKIEGSVSVNGLEGYISGQVVGGLGELNRILTGRGIR